MEGEPKTADAMAAESGNGLRNGDGLCNYWTGAALSAETALEVPDSPMSFASDGRGAPGKAQKSLYLSAVNFTYAVWESLCGRRRDRTRGRPGARARTPSFHVLRQRGRAHYFGKETRFRVCIPRLLVSANRRDSARRPERDRPARLSNWPRQLVFTGSRRGSSCPVPTTHSHRCVRRQASTQYESGRRHPLRSFACSRWTRSVIHWRR